MHRWLRYGWLLASLAAAETAAPVSPDASASDASARYRSPPAMAAHGDFEFDYPRELYVLQDYVYDDASVKGPAHIVVLGHRSSEIGDLRRIEINMLRSLKRRMRCADYARCRSVGGVVIGTDSQDSDFERAFEQVSASFKRSR